MGATAVDTEGSEATVLIACARAQECLSREALTLGSRTDKDLIPSGAQMDEWVKLRECRMQPRLWGGRTC